jgi:PAS domain S-box-containing protein
MSTSSSQPNHNRRSICRIPLQLPIHLSVHNDSRWHYEAMSLNLHHRGAKIITDARLSKGMTVYVGLSQGVTKSDNTNMLGEIRWSDDSKGKRCYGVSFKEDVRWAFILTKETLSTLRDERTDSVAESVLNSIPDGVFSIDKKCRITSFNKSAEKITGWQRHEIIGRKCKDILMVGSYQKCILDESLRQESSVVEQTLSLNTPQGMPIFVTSNSVLIMDSEGEISGEVHIFRNISSVRERRGALNTFGSTVHNQDPIVNIQTFGSFCLTVNGQPMYDRLWKGRRSKELLKAIIVLGGTKVSMEKIASILWPDSDGDCALNNLKMALFRLRKIGDDNCVMPLNWLVIKHRRVSLVRSICRVDALEFCRNIERITDTESEESLQHILAQYTNDFLHQDEMPWISPFRNHLRKLFIKGVLRFASMGNQADDVLLGFLEQAQQSGPLHEGVCACLMQYYIETGFPATALNIFNKAEKIISLQTGTRPGIVLRSLALQAKNL